MDLGEAVTRHALSVTGSTTVGDRVFWTKRKQGSDLPALVIQTVGGPPEDLDLDDEADCIETRLQFSMLAGTHAEAHALLKTVTDAFVADFAVDDFLFWDGDRERPIDLGSDTIPQGFIHEVTQDVVLRHSRG